MIEQVLNLRNLTKAAYQVAKNKGSSGIDKMPVKELLNYLRTDRQQLCEEILSGKYKAQAIKGVAIPKSNGKTRMLGVPTVKDRMLQQAVSQVIALGFEQTFKDRSYGFRPGKNAHQAVVQAKNYINDGNQYIVDIDLKNFFDEVDHCLILQLIYNKVKCASTMRLIRKWLKAPIMIKGKLTKRSKGVPQGSPLSPLLSNILLNELDCELEKRNLKYVRYADDFSIYCKSRREATVAGNAIYLFLSRRLKLEINREKSGIRRPVQFEILGYKFVPTYKKSDRGKYQLIVSEKGWKRLKQSIKSATRKTAPKSFDERLQELKLIQTGWINYFRLASIKEKLNDLDSWVRNRLRYCIWKDWKKPERKRKNLLRLGVDPDHAYAWSRTRKGGWAVSQSPILTTTITIERLRKRGYGAMLDYYLKVRPTTDEPLYT
ncbi:MAG: group II intron reverse transcriptase/maturase [Bacteroidia bacterium]|nr:group II intron reverse transcriptase/maturase [Bacteroidia bacterium]